MKRIDKAFKCIECEYCYRFKPEGFKQSSYLCNHPNTQYIHNYFIFNGWWGYIMSRWLKTALIIIHDII